jgi:hypothetical protein
MHLHFVAIVVLYALANIYIVFQAQTELDYFRELQCHEAYTND